MTAFVRAVTAEAADCGQEALPVLYFHRQLDGVADRLSPAGPLVPFDGDATFRIVEKIQNIRTRR